MAFPLDPVERALRNLEKHPHPAGPVLRQQAGPAGGPSQRDKFTRSGSSDTMPVFGPHLLLAPPQRASEDEEDETRSDKPPPVSSSPVVTTPERKKLKGGKSGSKGRIGARRGSSSAGGHPRTLFPIDVRAEEKSRPRSRRDEDDDEEEEDSSTDTTTTTTSVESSSHDGDDSDDSLSVGGKQKRSSNASSPSMSESSRQDETLHASSAASSPSLLRAVRRSVELSSDPGKSPLMWSEREVGLWLAQQGLEDLVDAFARHCISGQDLLELRDADLADLKVTKIGHKRLLLGSLEQLRAKAGIKRATGNTAPSSASASASASPRVVSPRGVVVAASAAVAPSPRAAISASNTPRNVNAVVASPRGAVMSPRGVLSPRVSSNGGVLVKVKQGSSGRVAVIEVPRGASFVVFARACAEALHLSTIASIRCVDGDGESIRIASDKDVAFILDARTAAMNISVHVN